MTDLNLSGRGAERAARALRLLLPYLEQIYDIVSDTVMIIEGGALLETYEVKEPERDLKEVADQLEQRVQGLDAEIRRLKKLADEALNGKAQDG